MGWTRRLGIGFAAVLEGSLLAVYAHCVGFGMLGVEVAAPDVKVTAVLSSSQLSLSDCAENLHCS